MFARMLTEIMRIKAKQLSGSTAPCLYNTIIMLSNRVFNSNFMWDNNIVAVGIFFSLHDWFPQVEGYSCETTTIIGVGNPDITDAMLEQYYTEITLNQYVAPSYNCLPYLAVIRSQIVHCIYIF